MVEIVLGEVKVGGRREGEVGLLRKGERGGGEVLD